MQILCIVNCFESNTCKEYEAGKKYELDPKFIKEHSMEKYFELPVKKADKPEKKAEEVKEEVKVAEPETKETK